MRQSFGTLKGNRRFRLLLAAALLLVAGVFATRPPQAQAASLHVVYCDYYSDATLSVWVGSRAWTCTSASTPVGTVTQYKVCDYDYCCGNWWC